MASGTREVWEKETCGGVHGRDNQPGEVAGWGETYLQTAPGSQSQCQMQEDTELRENKKSLIPWLWVPTHLACVLR